MSPGSVGYISHVHVEDDMKVLGLHAEWAVFRDMWRDFIWANV